MSETTGKPELRGMIAAYDRPERLVEAARAARDAGYHDLDALTPFPVEGLPQALGLDGSPIPMLGLIAGALGGAGMFALMWWSAAVGFPLNVGGRPFFSWPAFIPITFESIVLAASVAMLVGLLVLCRLPSPYHPLFALREARRAVCDRFVLVIGADDPLFDRAGTRVFLESQRPDSIEEVIE